MLRKYYGNLPPTDPRILNMTMEQIDLEFHHIQLDVDAKNPETEQYIDEEYEDYEKAITVPKYAEDSLLNEISLNEDDWEDVETDTSDN